MNSDSNGLTRSQREQDKNFQQVFLDLGSAKDTVYLSVSDNRNSEVVSDSSKVFLQVQDRRKSSIMDARPSFGSVLD